MNDYKSVDFILFTTAIYALANDTIKQTWLNVIRSLVKKVTKKQNTSDNSEILKNV